MKKANHKKYGLVEVIDYKRGWYTCETEDGTVVKSRAKDLEEIKEEAQVEEAQVEETEEGTQGYVQAGKVKYKKAGYKRGLAATPCGAPTLDIADEVADLLRGLTVEEAFTAAARRLAELKGPKVLSRAMQKAFEGEWTEKDIETFLVRRYCHSNNGMIRMNLGNVLRAALRRGSK
jgi:hypothetical protein